MKPKKEITHFSYKELADFLDDLHILPTGSVKYYKGHIDNCRRCWRVWNKVRWNKAAGSRGFLELQEYLGSDFQPYYDSSWAMADEWTARLPSSPKEVANYYKRTTNYLYNLIIWYESGDRIDFRDDFKLFREKYAVKSILDYGCGVGNDGLFLLENDFEVIFTDYDCPSTDFLKWRLKKRNLHAKIMNIEEIESANAILPAADMFWAIDVLEHMVDPLWVVDHLPEEVELFVHRSKFFNTASGRHPHHLPFDENLLQLALKKKGFVHVPWKNLSVWKRRQSLV